MPHMLRSRTKGGRTAERLGGAFATVINLLTPERARLYAALTMALGCFVVISSFVNIPGRIRASVDFPAFYNAGRIINEYPHSSLYDRNLQHALYLEVAPTSVEDRDRFFVYTPFFALLFAPLAMLSYFPAFVLWVLISLTFFTVGFRLVWATGSLPIRHITTGFILALSFLPFYSWCLLMGQTSAFGFFFLALAIYLDRKSWTFASGCCLSLLLYKPQLLILFLPMLVWTRRWRPLVGFGVGAGILALISFAVIGYSGVANYVDMLTFFSHTKATGGHVTLLEIDAFSFFLSLAGGHNRVAYGLLVALAIIVGPFLLAAWSRRPESAWMHAITWTLVLNFYLLIYDSTLIILAIVLTAGLLPNLPSGFRWLLLALFLVPWIETFSMRTYGFQPMTLVLGAFGCYQLIITLKRQRTLLRS
jgi:hypothetical protein